MSHLPLDLHPALSPQTGCPAFSMSNAETWSDFESLRHNVKLNTVDRLKQILTGFNDECGTSFFKSGKKQELIVRIVTQLDLWRQTNNTEKWMRAKAVLHQVRTAGVYSPTALSAHPSLHAPPMNTHVPYAAENTGKSFQYQLSTTPGPSAIGRYNPFSPPRKSAGPPAPTGPSTSAPPGTPRLGLRFRSSPFFRVDQTVSTIVECPESTSSGDRRQQAVTFTLNSDQITKMRSLNPKYQVRLFCTSSSFYSPALNNFRTNAGPCAIEFPPTCEVRVNGTTISANLKGLKKKPGTAPPADLSTALRISPVQNRVELVYVNSQQPSTPKKYYMIAMLVEVISVDQLVDRLRKGKYRSSNDVLAKMYSTASEDDDIVAGPQKMSLKCPLSFMRVKTPCRSIHCVHSQCFDATSWYAMMEQTSTWLCPVCEKVLIPDDLIIDGYFDEILSSTPESVEDVIVESNGEWHTSDDSYASAIWRTTHPPPMAEAPATQPSAPVVKAADSFEVRADGIFVLDSDDEDEGRVKLELSPSSGRRESSGSANHSFEGTAVPQTQTQSRAGDDVIDLTLDSDDEGPPPPPPVRRAEKRKADEGGMSPTEQIWKKGRQDIDLVSGVVNEHINSASSPNGFDTSAFPPYRSQSSGGQSLLHASLGSPPGQYVMPAFPNELATYHQRATATGLASRTSSAANDARFANLHRNAYLPRLNSRWPGT